jgi:hypothetical protein
VSLISFLHFACMIFGFILLRLTLASKTYSIAQSISI